MLLVLEKLYGYDWVLLFGSLCAWLRTFSLVRIITSTALTGDRLTGAVVRAGTNPAGTANRVCGSAVTNAQALERRSVVDFLCDPPLSAKYVSVDIPLIQASSQQICEVTVEEATPGPC